VSGAQHGTSGNSSERLRQIAEKTATTKANIATALQMISWGLEVNDYGNARLDGAGNFIKRAGQGVTEEMWAEMVAFAEGKGWKKGDYKSLNLPFESKLLAQPAEVRDRMARGVEEFAYHMMTNVLNSGDTAGLALEALLKAGSWDVGPKAGLIEKPEEWTKEKIIERAKGLSTDKGPGGNFED
jgi:fructose-bisphosphate aldolase class II